MEQKASYRFKIAGIPVSVNQMYSIAHGRKFLSTRARQCKNDMKCFVKRPKDMGFNSDTDVIHMIYTYVAQWHNKGDGKVKHKDGPNHDKMLHDAVCEMLGIDDMYLWDWHGNKKQTEDGKDWTYVEVQIWRTNKQLKKKSPTSLEKPKASKESGTEDVLGVEE